MEAKGQGDMITGRMGRALVRQGHSFAHCDLLKRGTKPDVIGLGPNNALLYPGAGFWSYSVIMVIQ